MNVGEDIFLIETEISQKGGHILKRLIEHRDRLSREKRWEQMDEDVYYDKNKLDKDVLTYSPRLKPGDSGILANLACQNDRSYEFSPQWTMPCPYIFMRRKFFVLRALYLWQHFYPAHVCCRTLDKSIPLRQAP